MSWSSVPLGEVFEIARGGSPRPIDMFITDDPDGLNWVKIGDATASEKFILSTKEKIRKEGLSKTRAVEPGDFLLTNSMSFGRPYIMGTHGCIHDGWLVLKPRRDDTVCQDYLYHVLGSKEIKARFASRAPGSTVKNLNSTMVAETSIPLPPLNEQRRIAGILDAADALRRRRREALALLDTLPGAIFSEMFGDPRDNPLGYPARKLSDLCSRITVGVVIKPASYYVDDGVPALRSVNVREGTFDLKDLKYFSQETNDGPLKKSTMREGDVVIVRTGQPGRAAVVTKEIAGSNCIDMLIASPKEDELLPYFLEAFLNSDAGRQMALSNQTGQVQQHLNATALKGIDFITPPIDEQREFTRRLDEVRRLKEELTTHLCELETLFASLQFRAFAGEL